MDLLDRISRLFGRLSGRSSSSFHRFAVRCQRCGELIEGKVNLYTDLTAEYGAAGRPTYYCRKVLIGAGKCYQQVEVTFQFDEGRRVVEQFVSGGEFVET